MRTKTMLPIPFPATSHMCHITTEVMVMGLEKGKCVICKTEYILPLSFIVLKDIYIITCLGEDKYHVRGLYLDYGVIRYWRELGGEKICEPVK